MHRRKRLEAIAEKSLQLRGLIWGIGFLCFSTSVHAQIKEPVESPSKQISNQNELLTMDELVHLVGPVALFPDDLLALVLEAASHPVDIVSAHRMKQRRKKAQKINANWDESVIALMNYPEILEMLDRDLEWTENLGHAKTKQPSTIMRAIEKFRNDAHDSGNLKSDSYQLVSVNEDQVIIRHKNKDKIYVPYYDPKKVRTRQPRTVYHYYPNAYPVYYYPYQSSVYFDEPFFGIDSVFGLSWNRYRFSRYAHSHFLHPYYGATYNPRYFGRSRNHIFPSRQGRERTISKTNRTPTSDRLGRTYGGPYPNTEQSWTNHRQKNRNRLADLQSDQIMTSNKSFRILDQNRPQRQSARNGDGFTNLGKQNMLRYPAHKKSDGTSGNGAPLNRR
ncbi:DUF3300 domain-containing protein [Gammaproteobacteria bacterium]|nr:DUF3300 domain-containing protein [Gammaproteobacteria bacterium]